MVKAGTFREDLYYRICVMPIIVPPLRERPGDILPLAVHFLDRERAISGKNITGFTRSALDRLLSYSWPGNVRELENKVKQSLILASGEMIDEDEILLSDEPGDRSFSDRTQGAAPAVREATPRPPGEQKNAIPVAGNTLSDARRDFERRYLVLVLRKHRGNATLAAREAGKHR